MFLLAKIHYLGLLNYGNDMGVYKRYTEICLGSTSSTTVKKAGSQAHFSLAILTDA